MSHSALRAQRKKEMDAAKEAEKSLQRESELQAAEKLKERLMAASLGRTNALRMTPQQLKKLGITIVYTSSPKKTPRGARSASAVAEGGGRSRRMRRVRRVRRHRMTHRRKHHVTRRRSMKGGNEWEYNRDKANEALVGTGYEHRNAQAAVEHGEQQLKLAVKPEDFEAALAYIAFGARYQAAILALVDAAEALLAYSSTQAENSPDDYNIAVSALAEAKAAAKEQAGKKPIGGNEWEYNRDKANEALVGTGYEHRNAQAAVEHGEQQLKLAVKPEDFEAALAYIAFGARYQAAILALVDAAEALLAYSSTQAENSPDDYNIAVSALAEAKAAAKEQAGKKPII